MTTHEELLREATRLFNAWNNMPLDMKHAEDSYEYGVINKNLEAWGRIHQAALQTAKAVEDEEAVKFIVEAIRDMGDFANAKVCAYLAVQDMKAAGYRIVRDEGEK